MTAALTPYPEYRDSGVEWLGEVPAHWEVRRLKSWLETNERVLPEDTDPDYEFDYLDIGSVGTGSLLETPQRIRFESAPSRARRVVRPGDTIVSTVRTYLKAIWHADGPTDHLIASTGFAVLSPGTRSFPRFVSYLCQSESFTNRVAAESSGVSYPAIAESRLETLEVSVPPLPEQHGIARLLDRETTKIDALLAKQQELIGLLKEKRSALISHAVTKGLDPGAADKDSGVEWLGEIPAHWAVVRLKALLEEPLHYGANEPAELMDQDLPRYIRITDINRDGRLRAGTFRSIPEDVAQPHLLQEGDILFARSGATVGKTFRFDPSWGRSAHAGYLIRARLARRHCASRFLHYFTCSAVYWDWLRSNFIQATIQNVSAERYGNLKVPLAPLPDQRAIADFLDHETAKIDALVAKVTEAIDHLTEYRTALISAAVTGKIDVRSTPQSGAAPTPDSPQPAP